MATTVDLNKGYTSVMLYLPIIIIGFLHEGARKSGAQRILHYYLDQQEITQSFADKFRLQIYICRYVCTLPIVVKMYE